MSKRTLLAVLAHPDDESFGMGGTLALYASRGVAVHLVCATRGEVGEVDRQHLKGYGSVAELRVAELKCAAGILGLAGIHFLDYRDSGMSGSPDNQHPQALAAQPVEDVAAKVIHYLRQLRPQVVLTFDPIGGYHHPDHVAIHKATVRAFKQAADPTFAPDDLLPYAPQRLYFHVMPLRFLRTIVKVLPLVGQDPHRWGRNGDIDLTALVADDFPEHAAINYRPVMSKKAGAAACHASQGGGMMMRGMIGWLLRLSNARETYMRAYPPFHEGERLERDLFGDIL